MARVTLSLGSNINPSVNIRAAIAALQRQFGEVRLSSVYESEAVGFAGDNFLNLVALIETGLSPAHLATTLKAIEDSQGRDRQASRFSGRTLDIDILTYDDAQGHYEGVQLPRPEITCNAYVLRPLAEILPQALHPLTGKSYQQLWRDFKDTNQRLWPVSFKWDE